MKCNLCERTPQTAEDLEHCLTCVRDGTAGETRNLHPSTPMSSVIGHKPALGSRFTEEPVVAQTEAFADQPRPPKPSLLERVLRPKRKKRG